MRTTTRARAKSSLGEWVRIACITVVVLGSSPWTTAAGAASAKVTSACDESCLKAAMDGYLSALVAHDASRLSVSAHVRFTENGVEIPLGEALWVTLSGLGSYRHDFYDPTTGGVATFVTMTENGTPGYLMARLKIVEHKLTEIETVVNRDAPTAATQPGFEPMWNDVEPQEKRLTREQMIAGAIGYMRAVAFVNGKLAPFARSCIRLENGIVMALGPDDTPPLPLRPATQVADWAAAVRSTMGMGCSDQLTTGVYAFITEYDNPRFPIVDVERQVIFGVFNFRRRGTVKSVTMPNGKTYPMMPSTQWPNEVLNTEAWKFRDGQITRIEAVFLGNKVYKAGTGWSGGAKGEKRAN